MDFTSASPWSDLNYIIKDNFKDLVPESESESEDTTFGLPFFQLLTDVMSSNRVLWSGSVAEQSFMNPIVRKAGWEADVMFMSPDFIISRDMQVYLFQDIPDEPGYVRVETAETIDNKMLVVKEITYSNGHSHLYIVPDLRLFSPFNVDSLLKTSRKNILVQSLFDTFELDNLSWMLQPHGPAFAHSASGFSSVFQLVARPKKTVSKFIGHLGTRVLEHFEKPRNKEGVHQDSSYNDSQKGGQMFDYMTRPTDAEIPDIGLMMDICPAIKCEGWPHKALRFFHRTKVWPDQAMLSKLLQSGFHLVYKPLNPLAQDSVEWRISFSQAEISLFQNMDAFRVYCYRIFKAIYYCELTLPKVLCSYHMKTIFLWACERIPSEMWVESNLAQIIMGLLDNLLHCLVTKSCPHYFIPENNLFAHVHHDFLDRLAKVVTKIRRNPEKYPLVKPDSGDQNAALSASDTDQDRPQDESLDDGIELD